MHVILLFQMLQLDPIHFLSQRYLFRWSCLICSHWSVDGPDGLSARFLKEVSVEITPALDDLLNISLCSGTFPSECQFIKVNPQMMLFLCMLPRLWKRLFQSSLVPTWSRDPYFILINMLAAVAVQLKIYF